MRCRCGYKFSGGTAKEEAEQERYAVVRNKDYKKFLRSEMRVLNARGQLARISAIARSSRYIGSALVCPLCRRLLLVPPGGGPAVSYKPEKPSRRETDV